jgi:hypothetical protein
LSALDLAHSEQAERTRFRAGDNRQQTACRGFPSLWPLAFQFLGTELVPSAGVEFTEKRLWAACPPDVPPRTAYPGGCRSSTLGLLKGRRIQRTDEVLDTCPSIRPLVAACTHARSVFLQPRQVTLPGGAA